MHNLRMLIHLALAISPRKSIKYVGVNKVLVQYVGGRGKMSGDQGLSRGTDLHWTLPQYEEEMPEGDIRAESETDLNLPSEDFDEEIFDQMGSQDGFVDQNVREQPQAAIHENEGLRMCVVSGSVHNQGTSRVTTKVDTPEKLLSVEVDGATRGRTLKMKSNDNPDVVDPKEASAIEDLRGRGTVLGTGKAESAVPLDKKRQYCAELTDCQKGIANLGVFKSPKKAARCYDVLERDPDDPQLNLPSNDYQNGTGHSGGSSSSTGNAGPEATSHSNSSAERDGPSEAHGDSSSSTGNAGSEATSDSSSSAERDGPSEANGDSSSSTASDGLEANGDSSSSAESDGPDVNIDSLDSLSPASNESEANSGNRLTSESNGPDVHIDNNPSSESDGYAARIDRRDGSEASPDRTDLSSD